MCRTIFLKENEAIEEWDSPLVQVVHRFNSSGHPITEIYSYALGSRPTLINSSLDSLQVALDEARSHADLVGIDHVYVLDLVLDAGRAA